MKFKLIFHPLLNNIKLQQKHHKCRKSTPIKHESKSKLKTHHKYLNWPYHHIQTQIKAISKMISDTTTTSLDSAITDEKNEHKNTKIEQQEGT